MRWVKLSRVFVSAGMALAVLVPAGSALAGNASAAKSRVTQAKTYSEENRPDQAEDALNQAEKFLDGLSDAEKDPILKDIKELRTTIQTKRKADESDRVERNVNRTLDFADQESVPGNAQRMIESATRTFEGDDGKKNLTDEARQRLQTRITAMQKKYGMATSDVPEPKKPDTTAGNTEPKKPDTTAGNTQPKTDKADTASAKQLDEEAQRILSSITRTINYAEQEETPQNAENFLEQARTQMAKDETKAKLDAATLKKLQDRIDAVHNKASSAMAADEARRLVEYMESQLRAADGSISSDPGFAQTRLSDIAEHLKSDEYKQKIDAATLKRLEDQRAAMEMKLAGRNKADALSRAEPLLKELEGKVASDPYQGVAVDQTYKVAGELTSLRQRVLDKIGRIPADDADRKAIEARLAAVAKKIEGYDSAWSDARVEDAIVGRWKYSQSGSEGWDKESYTPGPRAFAPLEMNKTVSAIRSVNFFLNEKETKDAAEKHKNLPRVAATLAEAEKMRADAGGKLNAAFNQWMDAAEKQPRPQGPNRFDIDAGKRMAANAKDWFEGTPYKDANVARAQKLDDKWQAELAAIKKQHEEALAKLTAEANANWPKIASSVQVQEGFSPTDAATWKGRNVRFKACRNRTGWDFDGQYDFVMWYQGRPIAGSYTDKVAKGFREASQQIGDIVEDHQDWDVIVTVEGTGSVNQRYTADVKTTDQTVIGKIEGHRPVECVIVKVIAVHAGPVAVGP
jgi:hypothetical protein